MTQDLYQVECVCDTQTFESRQKPGQTITKRNLVLRQFRQKYGGSVLVSEYNPESKVPLKKGDVIIAGLYYNVKERDGAYYNEIELFDYISLPIH